MTTIPSIRWEGYVSDGRNAISRSGGDGGWRVQFDGSDTDLDAADALMRMTKRRLIIVVFDADDMADIPDDALPFADGNGHPPPPPAHDPSTTGVA